MLIKLVPKSPPTAPILYTAIFGGLSLNSGLLTGQLIGPPPGGFIAPENLLPVGATFDTNTNQIIWAPYTSPSDSYFDGTQVTVSNQTEFNAALAAKADKTRIKITAGAQLDFGAATTIPGLASGWYKIQSTVGGWVDGIRVSSSDDASMPILNTTSTNPIFRFAQGRIGCVFEGIKFTCNQSLSGGKQLVDCGAATQTQLSHVPTHIEFRHCRFVNPFGNNQSYCRRGIGVRSEFTKTLDCDFEGFAESGADTQAIGGWSSPGNFYAYNCKFEAAGENIMFGGAQSSVGADGHFTNFGIRKCYFVKRLSWLTGGAHAGVTVRKNFFELKVGQRFFWEGNVCENFDGQAQQFDINLGAKPQSASETTWCKVQHGWLRYSKMSNSAAPMQIISANNDAGQGTVNGTGFIQVTSLLWHAQGWPTGSNRIQLSVGLGLQNVTIEHCNFKATSAFLLSTPTPAGGGNNKAPNLKIQYNINYGNPGVGPIFQDAGAQNETALNNFCGANLWTCKHNGNLTRAWSPVLTNAPNNNKMIATLAGIGFTDITNGNYTLLAGSPWKGAADDGSDYGINQSELDSFISGVIAGTP